MDLPTTALVDLRWDKGCIHPAVSSLCTDEKCIILAVAGAKITQPRVPFRQGGAQCHGNPPTPTQLSAACDVALAVCNTCASLSSFV